MELLSLLRRFGPEEPAGTEKTEHEGTFRLRKSSGELAILLALGVLGLYVTIWSELNLPARNPFGAGVGPRLFPQVSGVVMALLSTYLVIRFFWRRRQGTLESADEVMELPYRDVIRVVTFTALIVAYILVFPVVGFVATTAGMLFIGFLLLGFRQYILGVVLSIILSVGIYVVFTSLLNLPLPAPIFEGLIA